MAIAPEVPRETGWTGILERLRSNPQWDHITNDNREMRLDFRCQRTRGLMKRIVTGRGIAGAVCLEEGPRKKTEGRAKRFFDLDFSFCSFFGLSTFETFSRLFPLPDDLFLFCFVMQSNTLGIHGVYGVSKSHVMQGKCKM